MELHKLIFWTSHHQFYIVDSLSPFKTNSDKFWTDQAFEDKLAIEVGVLGVATECYGDVKGDLAVFDEKPDETGFVEYDHVVEGSLNLSSGLLQVFPCTSNEPVLELNLLPAVYRVRIYSLNLASVDGDSGDDFYHVRIWPEEYSDRRVLKR
jgi:hypothetical protein